MRPARQTLLGMVLLAAAALAAGAPEVHATGRDFIDETIVSRRFRPGYFGVELGADSRLDAQYRLQGWYSVETEIAPLPDVLLEGVAAGVDRGGTRGLGFAGWRAGLRARIPTPARFPADLSLAAEWEQETTAAKHPETERELIVRAALTRVLPGNVLATVNLGPAHRIQPEATRFAYGFGVRWPEGRPLMAALELAREPLELSTRITPQISIRFPHRLRLRLGGVCAVHPRPYWFVARAIFEVEPSW